MELRFIRTLRDPDVIAYRCIHGRGERSPTTTYFSPIVRLSFWKSKPFDLIKKFGSQTLFEYYHLFAPIVDSRNLDSRVLLCQFNRERTIATSNIQSFLTYKHGKRKV